MSLEHFFENCSPLPEITNDGNRRGLENFFNELFMENAPVTGTTKQQEETHYGGNDKFI